MTALKPAFKAFVSFWYPAFVPSRHPKMYSLFSQEKKDCILS